jgi:hypothetical protein
MGRCRSRRNWSSLSKTATYQLPVLTTPARTRVRMSNWRHKVAGAEHVYSFVLRDGLAHLHVVLAPRYAGTPREYWGVRLREWPDAPRVGHDEMRSLVGRLRAHVSAD